MRRRTVAEVRRTSAALVTGIHDWIDSMFQTSGAPGVSSDTRWQNLLFATRSLSLALHLLLVTSETWIGILSLTH